MFSNRIFIIIILSFILYSILPVIKQASLYSNQILDKNKQSLTDQSLSMQIVGQQNDSFLMRQLTKLLNYTLKTQTAQQIALQLIDNKLAAKINSSDNQNQLLSNSKQFIAQCGSQVIIDYRLQNLTTQASNSARISFIVGPKEELLSFMALNLTQDEYFELKLAAYDLLNTRWADLVQNNSDQFLLTIKLISLNSLFEANLNIAPLIKNNLVPSCGSLVNLTYSLIDQANNLLITNQLVTITVGGKDTPYAFNKAILTNNINNIILTKDNALFNTANQKIINFYPLDISSYFDNNKQLILNLNLN